MCICNIDAPIDHLNAISNEDQRDDMPAKLTPVERAEQKQALVIDCLNMAARDSLFDELVAALDKLDVHEDYCGLLDRARPLQEKKP